MIIVKPPEPLYKFGFMPKMGPFIFLSGSIEMGKAIDWQSYVTDKLKDKQCVILNPRRDDWNSNWKQSLDDENFVGQVNWELLALEIADIIAVHLEPNTQAPITLMEIGLYAKHEPRKLLIHCPEGYWRKGNIDVLCKRYGIKQANSLDDMIEKIKSSIDLY